VCPDMKHVSEVMCPQRDCNVLPSRQRAGRLCCWSSTHTSESSSNASQTTGMHAGGLLVRGEQIGITGMSLPKDMTITRRNSMAIEAINTRNQFRGKIK
jgi:hypothetical protein